MSSSISDYVFFSTSTYLANSAGVLLVFDYFLTFDLEVEHIWGRKLSLTSLIFYLNRYCSIMEAIFSCIVSFVVVTHSGCVSAQDLFSIFHISCLVIASAFNALRIWAIWEQRWIPLVVVLSVGMIAPIINTYSSSGVRYVGTIHMQYPYGGCQFASVIPSDVHTWCSIVARSSSILCDLLVLVGTLSKTLRLRRLARNAGMKATYSSLLVRDGSLYFALLLAANTANVAIDYSSGQINPFINYLNPLTSILISRFLLNLRSFNPQVSDPNLPTLSNNGSHGGTIQFASPSFIGNIGAPIDYHEPSAEDLTATLSMAEDPSSFGVLEGEFIPLHKV